MDAGPFDLRHLLIGAAIILVTGVAMFLLKGMLSFGFVLPIWIFVIIFITTAVIIIVLAMTIMGYLRYGSEGFMFAKARKSGTAIFIDAELGSDNADFALAEKPSPKDVVLKDEESGIKVDPSMLDSNCRPLRFKGGLDVYIYTYYNFMPQTIRNHAAFAAINEYYNSESCRDLRFLSIKEFVELVSDPEHYLERNALIKLNKYFKIEEKKDKSGDTEYRDTEKKVPIYTYVRRYEDWIEEYADNGVVVPRHLGLVEQDISLPGMIQAISRARNDISTLPVMGGLIAGTEAFKYNSVAYSSQHLGHVLMLYEQKIRDAMKGMFDMLTIGIVALMILCGTGLCIYIISMAFGK
jgi:hypothetical protein